MRDQSHSAERTATALGDGDPIATHATGHHTENGHTHQVSDPSNGITVSIQDAPARYGSVPNWSWITGMVIGATTHQRTSRPCVGTVTPSRARSQAIIVGTVCGQLIGNPRDALPLPLLTICDVSMWCPQQELNLCLALTMGLLDHSTMRAFGGRRETRTLTSRDTRT